MDKIFIYFKKNKSKSQVDMTRHAFIDLLEFIP